MPRQPQLFVMVQGDLSPDFVVTLRNGSGPQNLTGCTIQFRMKGQQTKTIVTGNCTIDGDPTLGVVRYAWAAGQTAIPDRYLPEFVVTFPSLRTQTWPNEDVNYVVVRAKRTT